MFVGILVFLANSPAFKSFVYQTKSKVVHTLLTAAEYIFFGVDRMSLA